MVHLGLRAASGMGEVGHAGRGAWEKVGQMLHQCTRGQMLHSAAPCVPRAHSLRNYPLISVCLYPELFPELGRI